MKIRIQTLAAQVAWDSVSVSSLDNRRLVFTNAGGLPGSYILNSTFKVDVPFAAPNLVGYYRVGIVGANSITTYPARSPYPSLPLVGALTRLATYDYVVPARLTPLRGVKRSTGRPFDLLRGIRRRVRR